MKKVVSEKSELMINNEYEIKFDFGGFEIISKSTFRKLKKNDVIKELDKDANYVFDFEDENECEILEQFAFNSEIDETPPLCISYRSIEDILLDGKVSMKVLSKLF